MILPIWITVQDALALHDLMLARHGGQAGLRDAELLQTILDHPKEHYDYVPEAGMAELAAAYIAGIVRNSPFADANRRSGFLIGALFLELNGMRLTASEAETAQAMAALASGRLSEIGLSVFLQDNVA